MSDGERGKYALALSGGEIQRYRFMAQAAREREAHWWQLAGITAGASVLDLGCGPGLVAIEMAQVVGAGGRVVGRPWSESRLGFTYVYPFESDWDANDRMILCYLWGTKRRHTPAGQCQEAISESPGSGRKVTRPA